MDLEPFKTRTEATKRLRDLGIQLGASALANMASKSRGPRFSLINGRALYRESDLTSWVEGQICREVAS
jgi:hypothetical protein